MSWWKTKVIVKAEKNEKKSCIEKKKNKIKIIKAILFKQKINVCFSEISERETTVKLFEITNKSKINQIISCSVFVFNFLQSQLSKHCHFQ